MVITVSIEESHITNPSLVSHQEDCLEPTMGENLLELPSQSLSYCANPSNSYRNPGRHKKCIVSFSAVFIHPLACQGSRSEKRKLKQAYTHVVTPISVLFQCPLGLERSRLPISSSSSDTICMKC